MSAWRDEANIETVRIFISEMNFTSRSSALPIYRRSAEAKVTLRRFRQRWRTHRCRVMSGTTLRRPRRKMIICRHTLPTSVTLPSRSSTSSSEPSASLTTCLSSSFFTCSSRSLTRYWRFQSIAQNSLALPSLLLWDMTLANKSKFTNYSKTKWCCDASNIARRNFCALLLFCASRAIAWHCLTPIPG